MSTAAADPRTDPERLAGPDATLLHVALPKGRMHDGVVKLLGEAGISVRVSARGYRPVLSIPAAEAKILKPQNVIEMLAEGTRDVGFAGADWVQELGVQDRVVELLDTELDPVRIVLAAPDELVAEDATLSGPMPHGGQLRIATEYVALTRGWVADRGLQATVVRSFGATEVFPPEDADAIVDNTATGSTLRANGLEIVGEVMRSSTRLYASRSAWEDTGKRARLEELVLLVRSVVEARKRVMLTLNVSRDGLASVLGFLPCMRQPTVAELSAGEGYSVQVAVMRKELTDLIPRIKAAGGTDVIVQPVAQIVP
ncbi:MAG: ATP phosphoribosyltransferase [Planctomycetota bacterium]